MKPVFIASVLKIENIHSTCGYIKRTKRNTTGKDVNHQYRNQNNKANEKLKHLEMFTDGNRGFLKNAFAREIAGLKRGVFLSICSSLTILCLLIALS